MSLGLSVSTHFHVSESWKCMRNECYLKDKIYSRITLIENMFASFSLLLTKFFSSLFSHTAKTYYNDIIYFNLLINYFSF